MLCGRLEREPNPCSKKEEEEKTKGRKGKGQALLHVNRRLSRRVDQGAQKSRLWEKEENKIPGHERVESGNADSYTVVEKSHKEEEKRKP